MFSFGRAKNGTRAKNEGGRGRGRNEMVADKSRDFENPATSEQGT